MKESKTKEEIAFEGANQEIVNEFSCTNCGADLQYKPGTHHLHCEYCGTKNEIPDLGEPINEKDFLDYLDKESHKDVQMSINVVSCNNCGAETTVETNIKSQTCAYCSTPLVIKDIVCEQVIRPKALLPFKLNKNEAREKLKHWVNKLWFTPNDLKKSCLDAERFKGLYVPYWTYDSNSSSTYLGQRGDYYYVNVPYTATENGKSVQKTRREQRTKWTTVSGSVNHFFDDVLVVASDTLPIKFAKELEPWDLQNLTPFNDSFLGGFITEKYHIGLKDGFNIAKRRMDKTIRQLVSRDIGGDTQRILNLKTQHNNITFKHILLPIYLSGFRYKGKVYQILINARTGEIKGERPYSYWKIAGMVVGILALLGILMLVFGSS
jgi:DNA-directed RNA polymerase subunit RPC12/RpoP